MKVAALIIGIDGWEQYTQPLIDSLKQYEPDTQIVVIDNASAKPYPSTTPGAQIIRTERLCYAAAINRAAAQAQDADWLIILSNDVICTGKFEKALANAPTDGVIGIELQIVRGQWHYAMGWCVITPRSIFEAVGGWDERYLVSSWEDVDFSVSAIEHGFQLYQGALPFTHLDQRQRFYLPEFAGTHEANEVYFREKHVH